MAIDVNAEHLLTAAQYLGLHPVRPHPTTFYRHHKVGVRGVRLEVVRIGGKIYTSREAVQRFAERLSGGPGEPIVPRTTTARRRASERAGKELAELGF